MNNSDRDNGPEIKGILSDLVTRSGVLTSMLVSKEGIATAHAGDTSYLNVTAMAALVAGMFSATREVARMVGEKQFSILLQQGENRHIHISLINERTMMVIIFEDYQRIGLVRHDARKAAKQIAEALAVNRKGGTAEQEIGTPQFKEYALNLIDQIFENK
jgi:predicted regulator of Ras-like GTPase activity (Roadblock/LC7/MglB family)